MSETDQKSQYRERILKLIELKGLALMPLANGAFRIKGAGINIVVRDLVFVNELDLQSGWRLT